MPRGTGVWVSRPWRQPSAGCRIGHRCLDLFERKNTTTAENRSIVSIRLRAFSRIMYNNWSSASPSPLPPKSPSPPSLTASDAAGVYTTRANFMTVVRNGGRLCGFCMPLRRGDDVGGTTSDGCGQTDGVRHSSAFSWKVQVRGKKGRRVLLWWKKACRFAHAMGAVVQEHRSDRLNNCLGVSYGLAVFLSSPPSPSSRGLSRYLLRAPPPLC